MTAGDLANCGIVGGHRPPLQWGARRGTFCAKPEGYPMAQTGWSARNGCPAELTTPALLLRLRPIGLALRGATLLCEGDGFDYNYRECKDCCGL